ncbi:short chain dehydrogenase [Planoprotostelium fungivorum]|uniref:Hydroxysteroid dehydrogenase-like protein 2 n=1 Tax=Planoprotostelium fungivorum TaxID=1890364 RepID=A0A2P6NIK3_9EUKA|nr:short chain dehydrogenase [Planoprotostelium fungivorum]PRP83774.1 short chain dehydrogenase [Planoprotostelium fungivorum]
MSTNQLKGKTAFITGASRGIGRAIALSTNSLAKEGVNIVIAAKSTEVNPKLPGTIYSVAEEIKQIGGQCLPVGCDIRSEEQVVNAIKLAVERFGGIDILINNASAIWTQRTEDTPMKRYDLMNGINARGTYMCTYHCLPHLRESAKKGRQPHVLMISPPLNMDPKWFQPHTAYTMAKYGMSMCVLGMAPDFEEYGIAVNALWPRTSISTSALKMIADGLDDMSRSVDIMSDATLVILKKDSRCTANFFIDDEVLLDAGYTEKDLTKYSKPGAELQMDFFLDDTVPKQLRSKL